ncbi:MAG TPA: ADP-ribosylation factor-like protein [Candidatus Deferrimicrobium sp.]|nr:ADP-ribosylation factor-like protein [Candidatus Deferrimicrobium sp.]
MVELKAKAPFKIIFTGLDDSGKTSSLYVLEDKFSLLNPPPTIGIERETFEVLGFPIIRWDLGGQSKFRQSYLEQEYTFADTDLLFYIIDIQNRSRFGESIDYFEHILTMFKKVGQKPPIFLCLHKFDPDLKTDDRILSNVELAKQIFRRKSFGFEVEMCETTIFEKWSLTVAFSKALSKLSPKSHILDQQLEAFANQIQSETVLLLDENALLFGQYFKNLECYDICKIISPHLATMADKIIKYGTNFEIFQVKVKERGWVFFRDLQIANKQYYLIIHNNQVSSIKLIDENIPQFIAKISNVIQSFFT